MPESWPSTYIAAKNELHSTAPWVWLLNIDRDGTNGFHLCGYDRQLTVGGVVHYPYPILFGTRSADSEGGLPELSVTVSNVDSQIAGYLEAGEIINRSCRVRLVNTGALTTPQSVGVYIVLDASVTLEAATFRLGVHAVLDAQFPAVRIFRGRCPYEYGGRECAYDTTLSNASGAVGFDPTTCDFTLEGSNGCRAHGLNERAHGIPELHPMRYGGFPSTPRGPARV